MCGNCSVRYRYGGRVIRASEIFPSECSVFGFWDTEIQVSEVSEDFCLTTVEKRKGYKNFQPLRRSGR
jgi:hypothetical protein